MWSSYVKLYGILTLLYLWYRFALLLYTDLARRPRVGTYGNEPISVIVPFYNEEPGVLTAAIASLLAARGNLEIIAIDDGSRTEESADELRRRFGPRIRLLGYPDNRGKRVAQAEALRHATGEFVVTVDSDTVVEPDAILHLIEPMLADGRIGATTGNVKVRNRGTNLLTRMIAARYWNAFDVERRSLSRLGIVTCCSGVLSAYRSPLFRSLLPAYLGQRFLGEPCTYGDDRHLTNLILKERYRTVYVHEALCHTEAPTTLGRFLRQQLRWKKSFLRESFISLTFAFRHGVALPLEVVLNLALPLLGLSVRLAVLVGVVTEPHNLLLFGLVIASVAVIRNFFLLFEERRLLGYSVLYAFLHEFALVWLFPLALFKLRDRGWGTR